MIELEEKLLDSAIIHSKHYRWDETLVKAICRENEMTRDLFKIVFPKDIISLAECFFKRADEKMKKAITEDSTSLPIHLQVSKLFGARLSYLNHNRKVVLKILSMKGSFVFQISEVASTADKIWNLVSHNSTGFDYYTRRMMLGYVYKNCLLQIKNKPGDPLEFMQKQLKFIGSIVKLKKKVFS